ncbi:hypothetical protein L9F63_014816 [Diploptera punctata]|uniref:CRAL-TRIO domain-containing protein n=1 Tax=Diploptera punctata TaxID=6984 RepID=A0AAD8EKI8_DIPPU|nr:hypothetical protein L9F63_014816 [Diploptera punctata]
MYFKQGVFQPPSGHQQDAEHLREWLKAQPHLPHLSDEHLYLFLNSCGYQLTKTKQTIDNYYTLRTSSPELFANRNPLLPEVQATLTKHEMIPLRWTTPEGYRVLLYRMTDHDSGRYDLNAAVKTFCMFNDMRMAEDGLCPGYIAIIDVKGLSFGHLGKFSVTTLKKIVTYLQECQPVILQAVHLINTSPVIDKLMLLSKPFIKNEIMQLIKLHQSVEELRAHVPLTHLPEDYGGQYDKAATVYAKQRTLMVEYLQWYQQEESLKVEESKRTGTKHPYLEISQGVEGSFRKLDID